MKLTTRNANLLLMLAAIIWGFAFVAQRVGMRYVGPLTFNGVRFALGAAALIPLLMWGDSPIRRCESILLTETAVAAA